ncbi:MAG: phosphonate C-P lyase system protein PhnH [Coriobacteriia bacterium]|jgi:alpha-D-ribose 1-methylphosphonate 5-triphosphate synthase subunit PhnH|nr:phosphonate C-P lyase system protein PhnH [Coriobacteriia bacterium]MDR2715080.1 phosphonate C-P lyase system protein PhnH [Coriobacteriales bacterium]
MTSTLSKKHDFDTVFDSQEVFRLILDALSCPARVVSIQKYADKLFGAHPLFLTLALTLLDNEVSFCVLGDDLLEDEISSLTLAKKEQLQNADFIFICSAGEKEEAQRLQTAIENAKCGTLADPHKSATIIVCDKSPAASYVTLFGPGIAETLECHISHAVKNALELRDAQNYEYPQGIDLIFVSNAGELFALPRLARMGVK